MKPRRRRRIAVIIAGLLAISFTVGAATLIWRAQQTRDSEIARLLAASLTLSQSLDRHVAAARSLLIGLSSSPALVSDNLELFDAQLKSTPIPEKTWFVLCDREKLLLHSLRPYGAPLPTFAQFKPVPDFLPRLEKNGFAITGRFYSIVKDVVAVTVNLKIPGPDGRLKYYLLSVLPDEWFREALVQQHQIPGATYAIFDRRALGITSLGDDIFSLDPPVPQALAKKMVSTPLPSSISGTVTDIDSDGQSLLVAFTRSEFTEWTATTTIPLERLNSPMRETLQQLAIASIGFMLLGALTYWFMKREVETPIKLLETSVADANEAVGTLTEKLLHVQEDEHQRIAGELHDSTVQHLTGALLSLMSVNLKRASDDIIMTSVSDAKDSVKQALNELRTFSFLLRPRDLGENGLAATIEGFVTSFAVRAGLQQETSIDPTVDGLPFDLQRTLLRITQEALTNVHRHADATRIVVKLSMSAAAIQLEVQDDGRNGKSRLVGSEVGDGVGIPNMRSRLVLFGGKLEVDSSAEGTTVRATIPRARIQVLPQ